MHLTRGQLDRFFDGLASIRFNLSPTESTYRSGFLLALTYYEDAIQI